MRCRLARAGSLPGLLAILAAVGVAAVRAPAFVPGDGKGKPHRDCLIGLDGIDPGDLTPAAGAAAIRCRDCDPGCDRDGVSSANGACSFEVAVCVNRADVPGCEPQPLGKAKVGPKQLGLRVPETTGVETACGESTELIVVTRKNGKKPGKRKVRSRRGKERTRTRSRSCATRDPPERRAPRRPAERPLARPCRARRRA